MQPSGYQDLLVDIKKIFNGMADPYEGSLSDEKHIQFIIPGNMKSKIEKLLKDYDGKYEEYQE